MFSKYRSIKSSNFFFIFIYFLLMSIFYFFINICNFIGLSVYICFSKLLTKEI